MLRFRNAYAVTEGTARIELERSLQLDPLHDLNILSVQRTWARLLLQGITFMLFNKQVFLLKIFHSII